VKIRYFDPESDSVDELSELNAWGADMQKAYANALRRRLLIPNNLIVAEDGGKLVALVMIMDGGFPFAIVDGIFIRPEYRGKAELHDELLRALDAELKLRGIAFIFTHAKPTLARALRPKRFNYDPDVTFHLLAHVPE